MGEPRNPAEDRYQLHEGTYRELIVKKWMMPSLKKRFATRRKPYELQELRRLPEDEADEARQQHADETERVKAAADQEVAAGRPIVVLAWQVQAARHAHQLADAPSWLTSPRATVRVFADDACEPSRSSLA